MTEIKIIKEPITKQELKKIAEERFGDLVKGVVDINQGIIALGGELHADEEVLLINKYGSKGEDTWGINLYPDKPKEQMLEFDSIINIKPSLNNKSRDVLDEAIREKIKQIIDKLIN